MCSKFSRSQLPYLRDLVEAFKLPELMPHTQRWTHTPNAVQHTASVQGPANCFADTFGLNRDSHAAQCSDSPSLHAAAAVTPCFSMQHTELLRVSRLMLSSAPGALWLAWHSATQLDHWKSVCGVIQAKLAG